MIYESDLNILQNSIKKRLSKKRFLHTLGVEKAARYIGKLCLPDKITELSAAALLHDVAKELPSEQLLSLITESRFDDLDDDDLATPALYHAFAAPPLIKKDFPAFASKEILSAVFNHTSGSPDMTLFDEIIFVSDFVEEGRTYSACKEIRNKLYSTLTARNELSKNISELHKTTLEIINFTIEYLTKKGSAVNKRILLTKTSIFDKIN